MVLKAPIVLSQSSPAFWLSLQYADLGKLKKELNLFGGGISRFAPLELSR